jgi:hypothetical protein
MQKNEYYRITVAHALSGYQLIESSLKQYLRVYYYLVGVLVGDRLHFGFGQDDIQKHPLGRLVQLFSKACADTDLVCRLRSVQEHRDEIAHRALLCLYSDDTSDDEYVERSRELVKQADLLAELLQALHIELIKLEKLAESLSDKQA